jgi:hypothetical protein
MLEWRVTVMRAMAWIARLQHGAQYQSMLNSVYVAPE